MQGRSIEGTPAQKRAFSLKKGFVEMLYLRYINSEGIESIIADEPETDSLDQMLYNKIKPYIGHSANSLAEKFGVVVNNKSKDFYSKLSFNMLEIKNSRADELIKASIQIKTLRIEEDGTIKESISFPSFKFLELIEENEWEGSTLYSHLGEKKFLLFIFKKIGNDYIFKGCQLWNMPYKDLQKAKKVWKKTKNQIISNEIGLPKSKKALKKLTDGDCEKIRNLFTKESEGKVIHVRPHTSKRYYKFIEDEEPIGENSSSGDILPDGTWMTKQCFWINSDYMRKQIDKELIGRVKRKNKNK